MIDDIALAARRYWRADGQDTKLEADIAGLFDAFDLRVGAMLAFAQKVDLPDEFELRMDGLFKLSTGGTYATANRTKDVRKADLIKAAAMELSKTLIELPLIPKLR